GGGLALRAFFRQDEASLEAPVAEAVERRVRRDAAQPRRKRQAAGEPGERAERAQENVLTKVLRFGPGARHAIRDREDRTMVAGNERREGVAIPGEGAPDRRGIVLSRIGRQARASASRSGLPPRSLGHELEGPLPLITRKDALAFTRGEA